MVKFSKIMVHFVKKNSIFFIIFGIAVNYHVMYMGQKLQDGRKMLCVSLNSPYSEGHYS